MRSIYEIRRAVNELVGLGYSVLPIKDDGSKAPALTPGWNPLRERLPTPDELSAWFQHCTGIGIICGKISGNLEALDFDDKAIYPAFLDVLTAAGYGELAQRLQDGWSEETPNGYRLIYRCSEIGGNTPLAKRPSAEPGRPAKAIIETRGEGGYFIVAPSYGGVHPTGRPYVRLAGGPETIPTITPEERNALFEVARSLDETPPQPDSEPTGYRDRTAADRLRPGDDLNAKADLAWWRSFLERHGWTFVYERGGVSYWRRPGKDRGVSATLNYGGYGCLRVFTTSTNFEAKMYRPFSAYVQLEHGGDAEAAARELGKQGYGHRPEVVIGSPVPRPETPNGAQSDGATNTDFRMISDRYAEKGNALYLRRTGKDGEVSYVLLANFSAWILSDVTIDDGLSETGLYRIAGRLASGASLPEVDVPRSQFDSMAWVTNLWGARPIFQAGSGVKDHVRVAILLKSEQRGFTSAHVYAHSGWKRIAGAWRYLHSGGALGADGNDPSVTVHLPQGLEKISLPDPPDTALLNEATARVLPAIHALGPAHLTAPLLSTPVAAVLSEMQRLDSATHIFGETGSFKSELQALIMRWFGRDFDRRDLPQWSSTPNALEAMAFYAKDAPLCVDDYVPGGSQADVRRQRQTFERLIRTAGNGAGRSRLSSDAKLKGSYQPRALIVSSGEERPPSDTGSIQARIIMLPIAKGDVAPLRLQMVQDLGRAGDQARIMSAFVQFVAGNWDAVRDHYFAAQRHYRDQLHAESAWHPRTPEAIAWHLAAVDVFVQSLGTLGALTEADCARYRELAWRGFVDLMRRQESEAHDADPVNAYFDLVRTALASGAAHLLNADAHTASDSLEPRDSHLAGWRQRKRALSDGTAIPDNQPLGETIGWIDAESAYLLPTASLDAIKKLSEASGRGTSLSPRTLGDLIARRGLLLSRAKDRPTNTLFIAGQKRRVLHVPRELIIPTEEAESEPTEPTRLRRLDEVA